MSASSEPGPGPAEPPTAPGARARAVPLAKPARPGGASSVLLAVAVAGLALVAATDLLSVFAGVRLRGVVDGDTDFLTAPQQELDDAASFYDSVARYQVIAYVPCAIAFVAWFFHMRRLTGPLAPDRFRHGPGWAVAAWLIPFANFLLPYRVATDMWRAATPLPSEGTPYRERLWPIRLWWALFVLGILYNRVAGTKYDDAETLTDIDSGVAQYMVADALNIVAAAAAVHFAVRLTRMQRRKAAEGPRPAPPFTGAPL
ncbi:DUF4328 domain-containing protein [Streptomyces sp. B3I8]|uniref:DUF4328 domain-containing protein n=1 Tax=Streptomyces sp. B3I8 TaxID=3042303 RepID=UPI002783C8EB|nr:DUF4328 domain-containing protein [Streptomyces sp. B3I8]MDQ0791211.1 hypothetical protein [Streptomyces sp. B3I8]